MLNKIFSVLPLRFWMGLSIVLMTICIILVITLSRMAPQIRVIPQLFRPDTMSAGQFVEATAINPYVSLKESKLIDEMLVRFYVENRYFYVPDISELMYRYGQRGPVARLSNPNVYARFVKSKGNYIEDAQSNPYTMSIDIWDVRRRDNVFTVDFDIYRFTDGRVAFSGTKRATVKIGHNWKRRSFGADFANPYGFFVMSYDETNLQKRK